MAICNPKSGGAILLMLLLAVAAVLMIDYGAHAPEKHGEAAWGVRERIQCNDYPRYQEFNDIWTGCIACCGQRDDGRVDISIFKQIGEDFKEITSFVSRSWRYVQKMVSIGRWVVR